MPGRLQTYGALARRLIPVLAGRGYYHTRQGHDERFRPGALEGCHCDLRHKTEWEGATDADGIPLNLDNEGRGVHFPITIAQKALGHWQRWLDAARSDDAQRDAFLHIARWLVDAQDDAGGWTIWFAGAPPHTSRYSAMAQGEAASVFARAHAVTGDDTFLTAADRAIALMLRPVSQGGTARVDGDVLILEEYPTDPQNAVLNGWIFSLYGLYDYLLAVDSTPLREALDATVNTLARRLPQYDAGYWSCYDETGNIASPFYHDLHIVQLEALAVTFPGHAGVWRHWLERWRYDRRSRIRLTRAVVHKLFQKLVHPPETFTR